MERTCMDRLVGGRHAAVVAHRQTSVRQQRLVHQVIRTLASLSPEKRRSRPHSAPPRHFESGAVGAAVATEVALDTSLGSRSSTINGTTSSSSSLGRGKSGRSSSKRRKLKVAVDVDEVLGRFLHSLNQFCREAYGMDFDVRDYHVYDFAKVWRCSQDESNHKVHEFFTSDHFAEGIECIPGSLESLQRLRQICDLMVVTSRQHVIQQPTLEWIDRHYPEVFREVHFGNHFALEGVSKKKSDICRSIGAEVLIDDNPSYAVECAQAGIHVLLYDWDHSYPWSKTAEGPTHDLITRVRDWQEVEEVLGVLQATRQ
ncbi:hypothetical protein N2152v2_002913 [Parachlorella kessleri]